jgi:hypothetical protein
MLRPQRVGAAGSGGGGGVGDIDDDDKRSDEYGYFTLEA